MKIMASGPITSWEIDGETVETVSDFILGFCSDYPKSLQMVTAAIKLKDSYSWEEKVIYTLVIVKAGIKIAGRNINNLRYADNTTLMAESEEEIKNPLMKVQVESEKVGLKLNIEKTKIMASGPITSWQIDGGNSGNSG